MKNYSNLMIAFCAGAIAGITLGLLFAPYKGTTTRQRLMDGSMHFAEDLVEKAEEGMSALKELKEKYLSTLTHSSKGKYFHN